MTAERRFLDRGSSSPRRPASGEIALAALLLCAVSGLLLGAIFDPRAPYRSISEWLLIDPAAALVRNLHYWAAQVVLLAGIVCGWQRLRSSPSRLAGAAWTFALALVAALMLSGFVLRGDGDAREVQRLLVLVADGAWLPEAGGRATETFVLHVAARSPNSTAIAPKRQEGGRCRPCIRG